MIKFIHAADIHLGSQLRGLSNYEGAPVAAIRSATRRAFSNLIDIAIHEAVHFVLLAGDVFDTQTEDYTEALFFNREMGRLQQAGIRVFMIKGNHDAESIITRQLKHPDNVTVFSTSWPETVQISTLGVAIHGQGFARQSITEDLSRNYPAPVPGYFNIGLLHSSVDGREGHANYAPSSVDGLRSKGYQYWALGHIHKHERLCEEPCIIFPGNLQGRHARETGAKGFVMVLVENNRIKHLEHRHADVFRWAALDIDLSKVDNEEALIASLQQGVMQEMEHAGGREMAIRVTLQGATAVHNALFCQQELWTNQIRSTASTASGGKVWIEKVIFETRPLMSVQELMAQSGPLAELLQNLHQLALDDHALQALGKEFTDLYNKLPPELTQGQDGFNPTSVVEIRKMLRFVEQNIIANLLGRSPE